MVLMISMSQMKRERVVTENIDSDDKSAVVRNLGDGWDDEECPEKESYVWQLRSKKAPDAGWIGDSQLRLEQYIKEKDLLRSAKLLIKEGNGVVKLSEDRKRRSV